MDFNLLASNQPGFARTITLSLFACRATSWVLYPTSPDFDRGLWELSMQLPSDWLIEESVGRDRTS